MRFRLGGATTLELAWPGTYQTGSNADRETELEGARQLNLIMVCVTITPKSDDRTQRKLLQIGSTFLYAMSD